MQTVTAILIYGTSRYNVPTAGPWAAAFLKARADAVQLARLCYAFFGSRSGGHHATVRARGAIWSERGGRTFMGGNGWQIEIVHDPVAHEAFCAAIQQAGEANDMETLRRLVNSGFHAELAKPTDLWHDIAEEPAPGDVIELRPIPVSMRVRASRRA